MKIMEQDIEHWLGGDNTLPEAIEVLTAIANGEYEPELFKEEVLMLREEFE
tara:strand:- start:330 stop:482 length:153 start_codon:yes stop_codon:yes gene_type:complete